LTEEIKSAAPELFIGLMSGTSLDGVDAVLAEFGAMAPKAIATHYAPFPAELKARLLALHEPAHNEIHHAALAGNELARLYNEAVVALLRQADLSPAAVRAIGCHGQTVRHHPQSGYTLQLNNPSLLAELSGIPVVADFRSRDIAAGGQGAPLVPAFHDAVFRSPAVHRIVLNIGGIANVTDLKPGAGTRGFDCGPGNILLDAWAQRHLGQPYDDGGRWGARGTIIPPLLGMLRAHHFFSAAPPKSCGREQFNLRWVESNLAGNDSGPDVQATLLELTATTIADAISRWCGIPAELVVCGGGAHNLALMERLAALQPQARVVKSDELDIGADWVEAFAFAWLARQAMHSRPGNLPEVTGARGPRILGAIYPA
jgi:anhydro-N-acetylmuramic acid kinase